MPASLSFISLKQEGEAERSSKSCKLTGRLVSFEDEKSHGTWRLVAHENHPIFLNWSRAPSPTMNTACTAAFNVGAYTYTCLYKYIMLCYT